MRRLIIAVVVLVSLPSTALALAPKTQRCLAITDYAVYITQSRGKRGEMELLNEIDRLQFTPQAKEFLIGLVSVVWASKASERDFTGISWNVYTQCMFAN